MKDSYSFDLDAAGLDASYEKHYDAYCRIFDRCGLKYVAVEAHSGAMGGSQSHEFMVASDAGEDFVACDPKTGYAANLEKAVSRPQSRRRLPIRRAISRPRSSTRPGRKTIAEVAAFTGLAGNIADEEPGDGGRRQARAGAAARRPSVERDEIRLPSWARARCAPRIPRRSASGSAPIRVRSARSALRTCRSWRTTRCEGRRNMIAGANKNDYHLRNVTPGEDFPAAVRRPAPGGGGRHLRG